MITNRVTAILFYFSQFSLLSPSHVSLYIELIIIITILRLMNYLGIISSP